MLVEHKGGLFFDEIYSAKINQNDIFIFDCGAGEGGSIQRFKKHFPECTIHSFEPLDIFWENLNKKYENRTDIIVNHMGVGERKKLITFIK